jgi:nucleoside-diphosphate-sugar epimerase
VFVGRRLVGDLVESGHQVAALNRGRTHTELPAGVEHLLADRTDAASLAAVLTGRQWDAVFDVSGFVMAAGGGDFDTLIDLLDGNVGSYVYVSSIMAYDQGLLGRFPWTEDLPTNREGPTTYGGFKAAAEARLMERHAATGFPATVARPAAIYGPDNNIYDMETPMFLRLIQHRPILLPHGGDVTGSYGHVSDLVEALTAMAASPEAAGEVFNISADSVSAARYVAELAAIVGIEPDIVSLPDDLIPPPDQPAVFGHLFGTRHHATVDSSKAAKRLGIAPRFDFKSGHEDTYRWFCGRGWNRLEAPLEDPVWRASWDFGAEADLAAKLRGQS